MGVLYETDDGEADDALIAVDVRKLLGEICQMLDLCVPGAKELRTELVFNSVFSQDKREERAPLAPFRMVTEEFTVKHNKYCKYVYEMGEDSPVSSPY